MGTWLISCTLMPAEGRPAITARLIMRDVRCEESRLRQTVEPLGRIAPYAAPNCVANSGVRSTLTKPVTPKRLNNPRRPCDPQMMLVLTTAPASISLSGHTFTLGWMIAPSWMVELSPITEPSNMTALLLIPVEEPTNDARPMNNSSTLDLAIMGEVDWSVDLGLFRNFDTLFAPDVISNILASDLCLDFALQDICIGSHVFWQISHITPVATFSDVAVDGITISQHHGEQFLAEVELLVFLKVRENLGVEDVDTGINGIAEHFTPT